VTTENVSVLTCEVIFKNLMYLLAPVCKAGAVQMQNATLTRIKNDY